MTTANQNATPASAVETPWYELIGEPEPPQDGMQQEETILDLMSILKARYESDPTVLYSNQTNVIYDSNVPGSVVPPDGFIVFGVDAVTIKEIRNSYRIDEWGQPPAFVLEVASESTASRDLGEKREIYARMNAQEYWRLDRRGEYYGEPLVGNTWWTASTSGSTCTRTPTATFGLEAKSWASTSSTGQKKTWAGYC